MAVFVGESAIVALGESYETNVGTEIRQVCVQRSFSVVIKHLAVGELRMSYGKVEDTRVAGAVARRCAGEIVLSILTDLEMDNGMIDQKFPQGNLMMKYGNNFGANREFVRMPQGWLIRWLRATHCDVVKVCSKGGELEIQSANLNPAPGGLICLLNDLANRKALKTIGPKIQISHNDCDDQQYRQSRQGPADRPFDA